MAEYESKADLLLEKISSFSSYIFNYGNDITLLELYTKALYEYKHLNDNIKFNNCFNKLGFRDTECINPANTIPIPVPVPAKEIVAKPAPINLKIAGSILFL